MDKKRRDDWNRFFGLLYARIAFAFPLGWLLMFSLRGFGLEVTYWPCVTTCLFVFIIGRVIATDFNQ